MGAQVALLDSTHFCDHSSNCISNKGSGSVCKQCFTNYNGKVKQSPVKFRAALTYDAKLDILPAVWMTWPLLMVPCCEMMPALCNVHVWPCGIQACAHVRAHNVLLSGSHVHVWEGLSLMYIARMASYGG